jgi:phage FluMu gp28-like protein
LSILYPYQKELIDRNNRFEINVKARQIGYSFAFAYKMLKRCILENRDQLIISASIRQSKRVMQFVEQFYRAFKMLEEFKSLSMVVDTQTEKRFTTGKAIYCLPAKPETVRSFAGDVLLDEFSLYKEDVKIYEAIYPSITRNYDIIINSTPLGKSNLFFEITDSISNPTKKKYKDFKLYQLTIYEAIKQGLKIDIENLKNNLDDESFRQEYECQFIDETTSYFAYELLKNCFEDYEYIKGLTRIGVDIGRTTDKTSTAGITQSNENLKYYLTTLDTLGKTDFNSQYERIISIYKNTGAVSGYVDKGAVGYQLAETLENDLMNMKGVFTNQVNFMNDVITFCKMLMEQGKFKFSSDNRDLINDFHKIQKVTVNNKTAFVIPRDKTGHGDRAVATMLALYGFKTGVEPVINVDKPKVNKYQRITEKIGIN